jgi:hypothetical protein
MLWWQFTLLIILLLLLLLLKVFIAQKFFRYKHTPGYMNFLNVPINHSELIMSHLASGMRRFVVLGINSSAVKKHEQRKKHSNGVIYYKVCIYVL